MTDIQSVTIPPTPDTVFALLNCSIDSPVLNHYKNLCFDFSGHSCDELYGACNAFRVFHLLTNSSPPCCFTGYDTVKFMRMNILDCTHYTTVINTDNLRGIGPLDWVYGIKLSLLCLKQVVNGARNLVGLVAGGSLTAGDHRSSHSPWTFFHVAILLVLSFITSDLMIVIVL
ncbi:hypothetical protein POTOM_038282 [Populus tomentosa]|uniref:Uncharacterized protein n=1 Tax=Populus tomentosa TaxID=118781 RepID=A0A8X7Z0I9_POPTO|nr:hypothetical protein POTOM_038282 [Populus tomentosa]